MREEGVENLERKAMERESSTLKIGAREVDDPVREGSPEYFARVAVFESTYDMVPIEEIRLYGREEEVLAYAQSADVWPDFDLSETYKSPVRGQEEPQYRADNRKYVLVQDAESGRYELYRRVSVQDICDQISLRGTDIAVSNDVAPLLRRMKSAGVSSGGDLAYQNLVRMPDGTTLPWSLNQDTETMNVWKHDGKGRVLVAQYPYDYGKNLKDNVIMLEESLREQAKASEQQAGQSKKVASGVKIDKSVERELLANLRMSDLLKAAGYTPAHTGQRGGGEVYIHIGPDGGRERGDFFRVSADDKTCSRPQFSLMRYNVMSFMERYPEKLPKARIPKRCSVEVARNMRLKYLQGLYEEVSADRLRNSPFYVYLNHCRHEDLVQDYHLGNTATVGKVLQAMDEAGLAVNVDKIWGASQSIETVPQTAIAAETEQYIAMETMGKKGEYDLYKKVTPERMRQIVDFYGLAGREKWSPDVDRFVREVLTDDFENIKDWQQPIVCTGLRDLGEEEEVYLLIDEETGNLMGVVEDEEGYIDVVASEPLKEGERLSTAIDRIVSSLGSARTVADAVGAREGKTEESASDLEEKAGEMIGQEGKENEVDVSKETDGGETLGQTGEDMGDVSEEDLEKILEEARRTAFQAGMGFHRGR